MVLSACPKASVCWSCSCAVILGALPQPSCPHSMCFAYEGSTLFSCCSCFCCVALPVQHAAAASPGSGAGGGHPLLGNNHSLQVGAVAICHHWLCHRNTLYGLHDPRVCANLRVRRHATRRAAKACSVRLSAAGHDVHVIPCAVTLSIEHHRAVCSRS